MKHCLWYEQVSGHSISHIFFAGFCSFTQNISEGLKCHQSIEGRAYVDRYMSVCSAFSSNREHLSSLHCFQSPKVTSELIKPIPWHVSPPNSQDISQYLSHKNISFIYVFIYLCMFLFIYFQPSTLLPKNVMETVKIRGYRSNSGLSLLNYSFLQRPLQSLHKTVAQPNPS